MKVIKRLRQDRLAVVCIVFLSTVLVAGLFAPLLAPYDPVEINVKSKLMGFSKEHLLGTDYLGRDILSRLLFGIRTTVIFALISMAGTILIGTILGFIAGIFRNKVDEVIMRLCDVFLSFPSEVMILAIIAMLGPSLSNIVIACIIAGWAWYTRMIRSIVIKYTDTNYIRFAKVAGCSTSHIIRKHILPRTIGEISVLATLDSGAIILSISALSFLGLGVQAPTPEWGMMLNEAKNVMTFYPQQMLAPGIAILLVVLAFNFLGDSLQDAFNMKKEQKMR
ncbi:nickel/cobalt ABC transporter permease [Lysinibacillus sp. FSL H8-0500]|uniref:nickel/cobalt ABC transporter permease n=1 Tax=Lysinibacillus sp. FSL H8-0500 TaxID=2921393 RepID=UPI0031017AB6